jgi:D-alanyl-D-alanine carboxypeptidase
MPHRLQAFRTISLAAAVFFLLGASWSEGPQKTDLGSIRAALASTSLPPKVKASIQSRIDKDKAGFLRYFAAVLADRGEDSMLLSRVDKDKALPDRYVPADLVSLDGTGLSLSRKGHRLRNAAFQALATMDAAARAEGLTLLVSSCYRSFDYQVEVWDRGVAAEGLAETEASVARPGHSQHQLGTALDFGSITDAFAETKASRWLSANARRFGFSLSYPQGMTAATGYRWESWHYRYLGRAAAEMEGEFFGGVQQYLLLFLEKN